MKSEKIGKITPKYFKPNTNRSISYEDNSYDLITSFGVLHHIPNVTVLNELIRVLQPGGFLLVREPISTMGDWRNPRSGLTKNERGISVKFFDDIFKQNNVEVVSKTFIDSLYIYKILRKLFRIDMNKRIYVMLDKFLSFFLVGIYTITEQQIIKKSLRDLFFT